MKNNKKRRFSAKKLFLGMFILVASFSASMGFAQTGEVDWDVECGQNKNGFACFFKPQCRWYEETQKCLPVTTKKDLKAQSIWNTENCNGENLKVKEFSKVYYKLYENDDEKPPVEVISACQDLIEKYPKESDYYICDYSQWLTNKGKRKCRRYIDLKNASLDAECRENAEIRWQSSLKDRLAKEQKEIDIENCNSNYSYLDNSYNGPVFDGPGLRGGSQMAQMELSNSISKQRDLKKLLIDWSKFAIEIAFVLAVIAIIWAGFRYITDLGDGSGVEAAKKIIIWTVVGILVILGAYAIVNTVITTRFDSTTTGLINTNIKNFIT